MKIIKYLSKFPLHEHVAAAKWERLIQSLLEAKAGTAWVHV